VAPGDYSFWGLLNNVIQEEPANAADPTAMGLYASIGIYAWRPNLGDEADNHLVELAVAGQANYLVTRNVRDLRGGELKFPHISVVTPTQLLKEQA